MTYWHVLWIVIIGGPLDGSRSYILYPSYEDCFAAHQTVAATLPYDYKIECQETDTASGSVRPKPRAGRLPAITGVSP